MTVIKIIIFAVLLIVGIVFFTLFRNDAHLFEAPGFGKRLVVYLTTNAAATADDHAFAELRTPTFNMTADKLYQRVLNAASKSGWTIAANDRDNQNANFFVRSPMFLFEDDVFVQVQFIDMNHSTLYISSNSRIGRADFAANNGNIQTLLEAISLK